MGEEADGDFFHSRQAGELPADIQILQSPAPSAVQIIQRSACGLQKIPDTVSAEDRAGIE